MNKLACIAFLVAIGCGGKKGDDSTMASSGSTGATDPNATVASSPTTTGGGVPCEQEIQRVCSNGMVDGCASGLTTVHACVPAEEKAGQPCAQEILKVCPEGQVDACTATPAAATTHICVAK